MQIVSDRFNKAFASKLVAMDWHADLSFTRGRNKNTSWFKLDTSKLDGVDLLATPENNPTQVWDAFQYDDITDRLLSINVERSVKFPYNVQSGIADVKLNNYDDYFSFFETTNKSPVADYILPKRPLRLFLGAKDIGNVQVFVGLTEKIPTYSDDKTITWSALDFLSDIAETKLDRTIMLRNVSTDVLLKEILKQYGMNEKQYSIGEGQNIIPFVYLNNDDDVGTILKKLVQAENGSLWLDEQGILRFENRSGNLGKQPVMVFDEDNIISIETEKADNIVNYVNIKSDIREIQPLQPIFSADGKDDWVVQPGGTFSTWLTFDDPVWTVQPISVGQKTGESWIDMKKGDTINNSGIVVKGEVFATAYKLTLTNRGTTASKVSKIELWGETAKVVDTIKYEAFDRESMERYGKKALEITDNPYFGSYQNCDLFATDVLSKYAKFSPTISMEVKGNPALQLGDIITVKYKNKGDFLITGIKTSLSESGYKTTISGKPHKVATAFVLDRSVLDGKDLLA